MTDFLEQARFFTLELLKFMIFFYRVWMPGFFLAAFLTLRFRRSTWESLFRNTSVLRAIPAGILGSADRGEGRRFAWELLKEKNVTVAIVYLIASRNMTIYFFAIFALSLGAEFAAGQIIGALVMIGTVSMGLKLFPVKPLTATGPGRWEGYAAVPCLPRFPSWRSILFSFNGWWGMLKFMGREARKFGWTLAVGIVLGGTILAAGLMPWWFPFADIMGHQTLASDLINALVSPVLSAVMFLSPVGNLPVIHTLFKADGLSYSGIISFCLASIIHPMDIRAYFKTFGRRQGMVLVGILYIGAILGGLGSTWIYGIFGFRPGLPPLEVMNRLLKLLGF